MGNAIVGYHLYLDKLFVPIKLAVFYPYTGYWRLTVVARKRFLLLVITLVAILYRRHYPWLLVGWLWFIVTLIPVIGLIQVGWQSIADRYTYIPSIGIFIMARMEYSHVAQVISPASVDCGRVCGHCHSSSHDANPGSLLA